MGRGAWSKHCRSMNRAAERGQEFKISRSGTANDNWVDSNKDRYGLPENENPLVKQIKHEGKCYVIHYLLWSEADGWKPREAVCHDRNAKIQILGIGQSRGFGGGAVMLTPIDKDYDEWNILGRKLAITLNVERAMKERK